ncbi:MAG: Gfo/Idh/MocA family oxidoreductase [Ignavibacteria bacterium]|nr:Gfo/Idh/MocA family oxidoreductase [Ignavibacteria bacterium]
MASPLSIGIIGCGSIGREHATCLAALEDARLSLFADSDRARAEEFLEDFGGDGATDDPARVFADPAVDAVYICTHHDSHVPLAIAAAEAGKHVFMEKPLALTVEDCRRIGATLDRTRVLFMTGFKLRFFPLVDRLRAFIPKPALQVAQICDDRWPDAFWGNDPVKGGGNVLSQGGHAMDLVCHFSAGEPVRIHAEGGNATHPGISIVDTLAVTISFSDGSVASLAISDSGASPTVSKFSFQAMDGERAAHLSDRLCVLRLAEGAAVSELREETEQGLLFESRAFLRALRTGVAPQPGYRDGLRSATLLELALTAARTGVPQHVRL